MRPARILLFPVLLLAAAVAFGQSSGDMEILKEKIRADKKLVIASNMDLTEAEAEKFWPVYENYNKELEGIRERVKSLVEDYAEAYNTNAFSDEKAKQLIKDMVAIEEAEVALKKEYLPKLEKALPARKVARYLQLENKIRAATQYELAAYIPLAE
jgi:hypothetical protein